MLDVDSVIMLDDNKEYYVLDSMLKDNNNFIMVGEINNDEITDNIKIMYYDSANNKARKIVDTTLLIDLVLQFASRESASN